MDLNQKMLAAILAGFLIIALLRVFSAPLRLALRILANTLLGFLALWAVNLTAAVTGISLGLNIWNALVIGVLGLPGFVLLLLVQWLLYLHKRNVGGFSASPALILKMESKISIDIKRKSKKN